MGINERLQTFYDARVTLPPAVYSRSVEAPPPIIFYRDYQVSGDLFGNATSPLEVPYPTTVVAGDFLICMLEGRASTWGNPPAPWTKVLHREFAGNAGLQVSWMIATGAETGTFQITQAATRWVIGGVVGFTGIDPDNPIADIQYTEEYTDTPICPAATAANDGSLVLRCFGKRINDYSTYNPLTGYPAGHTTLWDLKAHEDLTGTSAGGAAYLREVGAGAVPAASWGQRVGEANAQVTATLVFNVQPYG